MTKRKERPAKARSFAAVALDEYMATGEVTGLLALADKIDEEGGPGDLSEILRVIGDRKDPDVLWFLKNAAYRGDPAAGDAEPFRLGVRLADAEDWYQESYWWRDQDPRQDEDEGALRFAWEADPEYDPAEYDHPDMPPIGWDCTLYRWDGKEWAVLDALGAITFDGDGRPDGKPYKRVVEAEMALAAMPRG
jgi:hypothetical protein